MKCKCGRKVFKIVPGFLGMLWYCKFGNWHTKPAADRRYKKSTEHLVTALTVPHSIVIPDVFNMKHPKI